MNRVHGGAVVTGGGSGLGRATALVLAESGVDTVVVGRRQAALEETAAAASGPGRIVAVPGDVASARGRAEIVSRALEALGRVGILVNNAGTSRRAPLLAHTRAQWQRVMEVNLTASFFLVQGFLPHMREQGWGRIVNIASVYGSLALNSQLYGRMLAGADEQGPIRQPAYHASKGGLVALTRELAVAVAPWGITVNAVSPGMFLTEQSQGLVDPDTIERLRAMTPVGRLGDPREVGQAVRFLASEEASFITGVDLPVDGGWSCW